MLFYRKGKSVNCKLDNKEMQIRINWVKESEPPFFLDGIFVKCTIAEKRRIGLFTFYKSVFNRRMYAGSRDVDSLIDEVIKQYEHRSD